MQLAIRQEIERSEESRHDHRLHGLLLVASGRSCTEVGQLFGEHATTVQRWVQRFEHSGFSGLREGERSGRPRALDDRHWRRIEADLRKTPRDFGFEASLCGIGRSCPSICGAPSGSSWGFGSASACFGRWDFGAVNGVLKWPQPTPFAWRRQKDCGGRQDAPTLNFGDSGRTPLPAARLTLPNVGSIPESRDPIMRHAPTRKSVAGYGAVNLDRGRLVRALCHVFNAETLMAFLRPLLRHRGRGRRMVIVLDHAKYRHAVLLRPFLRSYRATPRLLFLPPYSPQRAPVERVGKLARRLVMHNRYCSNLDAVLEAINACFRLWQRPSQVLRRLCCIA